MRGATNYAIKLVRDALTVSPQALEPSAATAQAKLAGLREAAALEAAGQLGDDGLAAAGWRRRAGGDGLAAAIDIFGIGTYLLPPLKINAELFSTP